MEATKAFFYNNNGILFKGLFSGYKDNLPVWTDITQGNYLGLINHFRDQGYDIQYLCQEGEEVCSVVAMNWLACVLRNCVSGETEYLTDYLKMAQDMGIKWSDNPIPLSFEITSQIGFRSKQYCLTIQADIYAPSRYVEVDDVPSVEDAVKLIKMFVGTMETEIGIPVTKKSLSVDKVLLDDIAKNDRKYFDHISVEI